MVHAAATLVGLFFIGLLAAQGAPALLVAIFALACVIAAIYLFGIERAPASAMFSTTRTMLERAPGVLRGALRTLQAAGAADVTLRPALVQLKTRAEDDLSLAALVGALSAAPGAVAVDVSDNGVLVHVMHEDDESARRLSVIEAGLVRGSRGRSS